MSRSMIPPSYAAIWGKPGGCTGWGLMTQKYPRNESKSSMEGTAAHNLAATLIDEISKWNQQDDHVGQKDTQTGLIYTDEMLESGEIYAEDIKSSFDKLELGWENIKIEKKVSAPSIHKESVGTVDCFLYSPEKNELIVWDYKYGHGHVEAFENWQCINYCAGIFDMLGLEDVNLKVSIRIIQPRAFHKNGPIREWVTSLGNLLPMFETLRENAHKALDENEAKNVSGDHCRYCSARHACPAALDAGTKLYEASSTPTTLELSPEALSVQYSIIQRAKEQLEYIELAFEERIKNLLEDGESVPNYQLEETFGLRSWTKPVHQIETLGKLLGIDLKKESVITPKQAENLGVDKELIDAFSSKKSKGFKVVRDNNNKAKEIFK